VAGKPDIEHKTPRDWVAFRMIDTPCLANKQRLLLLAHARFSQAPTHTVGS